MFCNLFKERKARKKIEQIKWKFEIELLNHVGFCSAKQKKKRQLSTYFEKKLQIIKHAKMLKFFIIISKHIFTTNLFFLALKQKPSYLIVV